MAHCGSVLVIVSHYKSLNSLWFLWFMVLIMASYSLLWLNCVDAVSCGAERLIVFFVALVCSLWLILPH